jgi:LEA14-like dessication related protein
VSGGLFANMRPLMKTIRFVPACAAALLLTACALVPKLQAPQLSIADVQILSSDLWEQHLRVRMHVHNPNDRSLPIKALEYTVEVEGQQFASGSSVASFVVPPLGDADFDMNVTTNLASTFIKLLGRGSAGSGEVGYRLVGKVSLSEGFLRSVPFDQKGTFKLH